MADMLTLILTGLLRWVRTHRALVLENLALRHQLGVLQRTAPRGHACDARTGCSGSCCPDCGAAGRMPSPWSNPRPSSAGSGPASGSSGPGRAGGTGPAARRSPRRSAHSSAGWLRPTPCGGRHGFTANSGSWVSRSPRPPSPSTWSAGGRRRHHRLGGPFSPTTWGRSSPWTSSPCPR